LPDYIPPSHVTGAKLGRLMMALFAPMIKQPERPFAYLRGDHLDVDCITFLALNKGLQLGGRDKTHVMAKLADLAAPRQASIARTQDCNWLKRVCTRSHLNFLCNSTRPEASAA
jgi:hypothetical protein